MKKAIHALIVASVLAAPAAADVRPGECNPVLPVLDQTAQAPSDVNSQAAGPTAHAKRRFLGLLPLLPLALLGGLLAGGGGSNSASPQ